ncbi:site-specific integrase [Bradyrhizobium sp. AUGA SZCCT0160]|uniref:site-specific integrase n=1 Tax=Bradyrhizobium sp. AUGA SZCCT0160 TaxID=2807662 RepID=UPI001BA6D259|nr:site-specific integrase [Bradyrhizobium sp. AUGA SZCCT0160]MBR1187354.1 site-specific integrase [Bradyrhizobium sp. AUGA SZCCT0160]
MAALTKLTSGNWRIQIRRKGQYATRTFRKKEDAETWGLALEREIDLTARAPSDWDKLTLEELIDLYLQDMLEVGKRVGRTRQLFLESIRPTLGKLKLSELTRANFIKYGRARAQLGAAPGTVLFNFSDIRAILTYAECVYGAPVQHHEFALARIALKKLGLMHRSRARNRRPTVDELQSLIDYFANSPRQFIPMDRIIQFAVATAMREGEIFRLEWPDVDMRKRLMTVRDRKAPQYKEGNHEIVPMLSLTGFDAWQLLLEQRILTRGKGRVFPYSASSAGAAFSRACKVLHVEDLRFHDLRREAATRLFEAGLPIERVALVTGHKSWDMLRRYTRLRPEDLVKTQPPPETSVADFIDQLIDS